MISADGDYVEVDCWWSALCSLLERGNAAFLLASSYECAAGPTPFRTRIWMTRVNCTDPFKYDGCGFSVHFRWDKRVLPVGRVENIGLLLSRICSERLENEPEIYKNETNSKR